VLTVREHNTVYTTVTDSRERLSGYPEGALLCSIIEKTKPNRQQEQR